MGLFDSMCVQSGLIIDSRQRLILIAEQKRRVGETEVRWAPIALPIDGKNDRGGTMDVPRKLDANMKAVVAFGRGLAYRDEDVKAAKVGLEEMLDELRGDGSGATWKERAVSFALVEGAVFDAIVKAVAKNGATAWKRYAQLGLGVRAPELPNRKSVRIKARPVDATTKRLCEAILAAPADDGARKVYVDHLLERDEPRGRLLSLLPALRKVNVETLAEIALPGSGITYGAEARAALVELVQFLAWGTPLTPAYGEGQFTQYDGPEGVGPYIAHARKKYEGMPELLAVVAANEKTWHARIAELNDDEDDD
ncbi:MAG: hypothetical protein M4D80_30340 [Myxococcota bacterium]|nr:hypothetical protein [Deltaproteobacteria bacterium]MDQ3339485.1 hypothetical protein [Myxococcota bacterium]